MTKFIKTNRKLKVIVRYREGDYKETVTRVIYTGFKGEYIKYEGSYHKISYVTYNGKDNPTIWV